MSTPRVLVAGIGNVFFADDGFGPAVAEALVGRTLPEGARVEDYGIRGVHLAYELLDGYDVLVMVDAVPLGDEPPGTVVLIEPEVPDVEQLGDVGEGLDAHTMNPAVVLSSLAKLGGEVGRIVIVGCQPERIEPAMGLSPVVQEAVEPAAREVLALLEQVCRTREETRT